MNSIGWLMQNHKTAFDALPEAYQADDCLTFFYFEGMLKCKAKRGQETVLGRWESTYYPIEKEWK